MLLRSGYEATVAELGRTCANSAATPLHAFRGSTVSGELDLSRDPSGRATFRSRARDLSGSLNINDGISAGTLELGTAYDPAALDPWSATDPAEKLASAWINLRLRRLLNAYGDVHKFVDELGEPVWRQADFDADPGTGWSQPFTPTSTAAGDRGVSQPGGQGLGDLIIAARPVGGFKSIEDVRSVVTGWAADHLSAPGPGEPGFFDVITADLTVDSWVDPGFWRMTREFGVYTSDPLESRVDMLPLDRDPPDLTTATLWKQHPVTPVNLNSCSFEVRAAVFHAPTNVGYVCEGEANLVFDFRGYRPGFGSPYNNGLGVRTFGVPLLGVGGPVFESIRENGVAGGQGNRFMSMRDALALARAYEELSTTFGAGWPDGFVGFERHLRSLREDPAAAHHKVPYERVPDEAGSDPRATIYTDLNDCVFNQEYVERTLPRILSPVRRLPGWMQAPLALMSPYMQEGPAAAHPQNFSDRMCLRSIEDFVFRSHLPKVSFAPGGRFGIDVSVRLEEGGEVLARDARIRVEMLRHVAMRTQEEFDAITATETGPEVTIGPESESFVAHPTLGVVGLRDRIETSADSRPHSLMMEFNGNFDVAEVGVKNHGREYPASDDPFMTESILHSVPDPWAATYPPDGYPMFGSDAFDVGYLTAIRGNPETGVTWRVPRDSLEVLNEALNGSVWVWMVPGGPWNFPLSESRMRDLLPRIYAKWGAHMAGSYPGDGKSMDEYLWVLMTDLMGTGDSSLEHWFGNWTTNGPPRSGDDSMSAADMEDGTVSLFALGAGGCDLSPFGGLSFSSRGHGSYASPGFTDSFYLRPARLIGADSPGESADRPGSVFNRGTFVVWARLPSGMQRHQVERTLWHMTLWENVEEDLGSTDEINVRPVHFDIKMQQAGIQFEVGNGMAPAYVRKDGIGSWGGRAWSEIISLPLIPNTPPFPADFLGVPDGATGGGMSRFNRWGGDDMPKGADRVKVVMETTNARPGSWVRLMFKWDYADDGLALAERLKGWCGTPGAESFVGHDKLSTSSMTSFNEGLVMSVGDNPMFLVEHHWPAIEPLGPLPRDQPTSLGRWNSSLDDIDIRFGSVLTGTPDDHVGYETRRYEVTPSNEPAWILHLPFPQGSRLVRVGCRVFDVPLTAAQYNDHDMSAPWVETVVMDSGTAVNPVSRSDPGSSAPFRSPEATSVAPVPAADGLRIHLVWRATSPAGAAFLKPGLSEIPWLEEVSVSYLPAGGPAILDWRVD